MRGRGGEERWGGGRGWEEEDITDVQCNFSKPNTLGTKEMVQFREVSGLERFCMYSKYREQDLKTCPV